MIRKKKLKRERLRLRKKKLKEVENALDGKNNLNNLQDFYYDRLNIIESYLKSSNYYRRNK